MASRAYVDALKMLGRRELSEAQVRGRLARRGHESSDIDDAVTRLREERAIDDARVAEAIARSQTGRGRGPLRVRQALARAGIDPAAADRAVDTVRNAVDDEQLIDAALAKRLRGRPIGDDRELQRLYRHLVGRGFEPDRVLGALRKRRTDSK